ncbi:MULTISPECIES: rRNA maturation RNase YbeY [unclassified Spiroplasma]|uniref:rRNA maturation RNase YbeY n=1 Tax=unclassified Spiroplasma TaxID=2637901 RepID=UPI00120F8385|nr:MULTISPECIES: rRNA maturation RNase YbeY [unclassified Spiroplasma]MBP1525863.1 rRNA maturation RNase YbeY [Spiroplasma ixodetis]MBP1527257.1 rRNA maturation RNase YbeY [Spiroplasma ixodetis]MBP1528540.1 rRNA maturation RNase YbeY [Spiroplasma ixodetis]TLF28075.1 MAG: rRNA maturation RNase YbeY [Spiroplasma sp. WSS]
MPAKINIVNIYNDHNYDIKNFNILSENILNAVAIKLKQKITWCIAVIFNDEQTSIELNKMYRHKDYVPDVLSFGNNDDDFPNINIDIRDLGDVYICYSKAVAQAQEYGHSLIRELSFLFIHGLLHTLGYDHQNSVEEKVMFDLQDEILNILGITRK